MLKTRKKQRPAYSLSLKSWNPRRNSRITWILALCLLLVPSLQAANFELALQMEQSLAEYPEEGPSQASPPLLVRDEGLLLKTDPVFDIPVGKTSLDKEPHLDTNGEEGLWLPFVHFFWLGSALFLLAHIFREWGKVILMRLRREQNPKVLEYANWPIITLLVVPKGDASAQEHRLDALRSLPFDYPSNRIHFVVAYHTRDLGVRDAIHRLGKSLPERVQALPILPEDDASLATLLPRALGRSVGEALVVLDQHLPVPRDWLRNALSPLLDPAIGVVLNRAVPGQVQNALATRLVALAGHADALLANQTDALDLMLCGKARIRALRRSAYKAVEERSSELTPDGASIVLELVRSGWQASLLEDIDGTGPIFTSDTIRSPRLHPAILLQSLSLTPLALSRSYPQGARKQGRMVFFAALLPWAWIVNLILGFLLYAFGDIFTASLALALCAATSFDPLGHPKPAFSIAASARMAGIREEIRILPLASISFLDRMFEACRSSFKLRHHVRSPKETVEEGTVPFASKEEMA